MKKRKRMYIFSKDREKSNFEEAEKLFLDSIVEILSAMN